MYTRWYVQLAIFLVLIFGCDVTVSRTGKSRLGDFPILGTTVVISPNENITCESRIECVENTCSNNLGRICTPTINNKWVQFAIMICNPNTPYCNNGVCTENPPPDCTSLTFSCPEINGSYPDPSDCGRYYKCANGFPTAIECPRKNVYNHKIGDCKYPRTIFNCATVKCLGRDGLPFVYPKDDRIYGRCISGKPHILGRCQDYEKYDLIKMKCVRHCRRAENQPADPTDPDACRKYIRCAKVSFWGRYEPVEVPCGCNEGYDKEQNTCVVNATCLKNIPQPWCKKSRRNSNLSISLSSEEEDSDSIDDDSKDESSDDDDSGEVSPLIINNSSSSNSNKNGNDRGNGNIVNGNKNGNNSNSGNVINGDVATSPLVINNSGNNNHNNSVSNGNDTVDGNLVNGNGNGDNTNSGNVASGNPVVSPLIINNFGDKNNNNRVSNGDDNVNGNLVNGNGNGDNIESGNVKRTNTSILISNTDDDDNDVANENNVNGNVVDGDDNSNNNDNTNIKSRLAENTEDIQQIRNFMRIFIDWIINITVEWQSAR